MNSKFLLIGSLSVLTAIGLFFASMSTDEVTPSEMNTDIVLIPSAQEFLKMDCKELEHIFPEFPSVEVADAWNTRMHECINEQESLQLEISMPVIDKGIIAEMENLQQMSCDEIIQRNTEGEYLSSENRKFAREKVLGCSDIEESFAVNASCEELYERYHSGQEYWFEDHKQITENRLAKCSGIMGNEK